MTTAPTAPQARPYTPATLPAARAPRTSGSGLPDYINPPGMTTSAEPAPPRQATVEDYEQRIADLEARAAALDAAPPRPLPEPPPANHPTEAGPKRSLFDRFGPYVAMYAAVGLSASGEYALAHMVRFPGVIAALLPIAIDIYVVQAMRRHRDVAAALILMVATNALFHLADAGLFGVTPKGKPTWWLIVAVVAIAPFIVWRVHRITEVRPAAEPKAAPKPQTEAAPPAAAEPEVPASSKSETAFRAPTSNPEPTSSPKPEAAEVAKPKPETARQSTPRRTTPKPETRNAALPAPGGQRAKKATEVEVVLGWMISGGGPKSVPMRKVEEHFGLSTTTAYDRWKTAGEQYAARTPKP